MSEAPSEVLGGQVPFSKLASKDAALFALPKGRRDALGNEYDHRTQLLEPGVELRVWDQLSRVER